MASSLPVIAPTFGKGRFGQTARRDTWWLQPSAVFIGLLAFIVYATWAAFQGNHYRFGNYLSPFYSPELWGDPAHAWFGGKPGWWPSWLVFSPAILILGVPGGFRLTCYYYRGAYYKAYWADPPSCTVGEPRKAYLGENWLPLVIQNVHRYFLYISLLFLVFLFHDAWNALWFANPAGGVSFGIGIGTLVLLLNPILLTGYAFGCHSLRHLCGGGIDEISKCPIRQRAYFCASAFNRAHMGWAWPSLFFVAFTDLYVRLCAMGVWHDWRIL